ncbi:peptide ABC transporter substrate-binding protein [Microbacterium saperdae]|uniref:Oligopeptide transport system substrate-binding protein n=1 Tax=Microbacterium saperdae TaxID=69368 RepID=A0A543BPL9_9MICO|nr:ABC transporter substrate-binding protein [Microbacterium saperdae]TQL86743.1 oligopeptide transport system substrate-binding protein [Microbacterium saperdae]GGM45710.1 ABC transporter substrate-binding protein [Microbacterium saperdae]
MKRNKIALAGVALFAIGAMALAGCASGSGDNDSDKPTGDASAVITANGSEPENPLIPTNTNEVGGGKILDSIFAGLAYYDGKGALVNDMAEEITVDSPTQLTIKLKKDQKFTDGTDVLADNFIKAWNYGALLSNKQLNQSWFSDIVGFSDSADAELTGLKKVDDLSFTIELTSPVATDFATRLGYSAYYPLPDVAFDDMAAFGENPIGNGPYKLDGDGAWQHDISIALVKNDDYQGGREVVNGGLTVTFYTSLDAAYADLLSGELDVLDAIPDTSIATFEDELGDRAVNQPAAIFQSFTIGEQVAHFAGEEGKLRRAALSMAINREEITDKIFNGTRTPASDFTSPVIDGWSDELAGADVLSYNPDEAKKLWAEADAISPWSGTFQIAYNSDSAHQAWVDAVSNSIKNTLGIEASGAPFVDFATLRATVNERGADGKRTIQTANRSGWQADYPGLYNFLFPLYSTGASSNDGDYANPEFDELLAKGASASDQADAIKDYQQAQEILLEDLPAVPLWYQNVSGGFGESVDNVTFGWNSVPLYYEITKTK